jgi:hypothetical protein
MFSCSLPVEVDAVEPAEPWIVVHNEGLSADLKDHVLTRVGVFVCCLDGERARELVEHERNSFRVSRVTQLFRAALVANLGLLDCVIVATSFGRATHGRHVELSEVFGETCLLLRSESFEQPSLLPEGFFEILPSSNCFVLSTDIPVRLYKESGDIVITEQIALSVVEFVVLEDSSECKLEDNIIDPDRVCAVVLCCTGSGHRVS